jgi:hypothetical protein
VEQRSECAGRSDGLREVTDRAFDAGLVVALTCVIAAIIDERSYANAASRRPMGTTLQEGRGKRGTSRRNAALPGKGTTSG